MQERELSTSPISCGRTEIGKIGELGDEMSDQRNPGGPRAARRSGGYWLLAVLAILGVVLAVLIATLLFGQHGGEEFCPNTFSRRTFFYFQVPLVGIQVTPIFRDKTTNSLENYLVAHNLIKTTPTARWDLVRTFGAGSGVVCGDAEILTNYLDASDADGDLVWQKWSDKHGESAKHLWPPIAELARQQLYIFVPELFELASAESDPQKLARELHKSLARQYLRLAKIQQQLGRHDAALDLLNHARDHDPTDEEIRRSREASSAAVGSQHPRVLEKPDQGPQ